MYKLVIVDDEQEVRQGIINKIDWSKFNFTVSGQAENGREALEIIEEDIPDVVITDISMPLMDGLQLTELIKESYPTVKVIILTGYDEFKYAQQAIKYDVSDYILKPILPKDIEKLMSDLKNSIDEEIAEKEDKIKLQQHYTESLPILRESFLTSLILIRPGIQEIEKKIESFDLSIKGKHFAVAVVGYDSESIVRNSKKEWDIELIKFSILNIAQEILNRHGFGEAFFFNNSPVIIAGFNKEHRNIACSKMITLMEEIRQQVIRFLKLTVTIGVGSMRLSLEDMNESYKSALAALDYKLILGGNKVIFVEDIEQHATDIVVFSDAKERMLISSIKFGTKDDVKLAVEALFSNIGNASISIKDYQLYFFEILTTLTKLARTFGLDSIDMLADTHEATLELSRFNTMDEVKEWLTGLGTKLMKEISSQRIDTTQVLFDRAKDYIKKNYGERELSVQKLADHLYISTSYLALIFKKQANTTFLKYLIKVRLDAAIELLNDLNKKITEVAEKVGYPDISYFSYFFKKNYGISPREYRSRIKQKQ